MSFGQHKYIYNSPVEGGKKITDHPMMYMHNQLTKIRTSCFKLSVKKKNQ